MEPNVSEKEQYNSSSDIRAFQWLYDTHSAKIFGFILKYYSKKEAEQILINIYLKFWEDIKFFKNNSEKRIMGMVLSSLRAIYKKDRGA